MGASMCGTYFIQPRGGGLIKIGRSGDLFARFVALQGACPIPLGIRGFIEGTHHEQELHKKFKRYRRHGEWFYPADVICALADQHAWYGEYSIHD